MKHRKDIKNHLKVKALLISNLAKTNKQSAFRMSETAWIYRFAYGMVHDVDIRK